MDRSGNKKDNDLPLKLFDPKYKLNVGNMEVRYPVLSQHPKYGSRYMVLDEQPVKEFYGTAKPTIEEMREKENRILGTLDFHSPLLKPDWRISFKGDSIYRAREPNWLGKYQNSKEKFADYNTETKMLKGAEKQPANKGKVRFVERTYHNRYNEESVYRSPNGKSGHYIERSFNPRAQKQSNKRKQDKYTENSLNPHFHEKYPHPSNKAMGYYDKVTFDPNEKFNVRYLPPIERKGKYASVTSKVKSFDNASYKPGGGHKYYPTFDLNWNVEAKVETLKQFKSKSYPNTETGSSDPGQQPEVQSQLEFASVADDRLPTINNTRTITPSVAANSMATKSTTVNNTRTIPSVANSHVGKTPAVNSTRAIASSVASNSHATNSTTLNNTSTTPYAANSHASNSLAVNNTRTTLSVGNSDVSILLAVNNTRTTTSSAANSQTIKSTALNNTGTSTPSLANTHATKSSIVNHRSSIRTSFASAKRNKYLRSSDQSSARSDNEVTVTSPDTKHNENQQIQSECRLIDKEDSECLTSPQISRGDMIPDERSRLLTGDSHNLEPYVTKSDHVVTDDSQKLDTFETIREDDTNTVSDIAPLPKTQRLSEKRYSNTSAVNSKSPISKYQESRQSRSQNTNKGTVKDINKTDLNSTPSYLHKNGSRLSQQQPNTDKKDPQISVSKSCDMAELGTSTPGSQSQMTSTVTEDTLKNTQEINQPENILHENNNPSYSDPRQKNDSRVGVKLQSDVVDIPTNQNIRISKDSKTKPMNKDKKSTDFRIIRVLSNIDYRK